MIDAALLKRSLAGLATRASHAAKVEEWATNTLSEIPAEILPRVPEGAMSALIRLAAQCESIGPRILQTRKFGTIGDINWGGDSDSVDESLAAVDLRDLASRLLDMGMKHGIMAGITRRDETGELVIEPLVGYVEPIPSKGTPTGLVHAWVDETATRGGTQSKWTVRVYDFAARTMTEWTGLDRPEQAATKTPVDVVGPNSEYPAGAPTPRFIVLDSVPRTGRPYGELDRILPLIQSDWSSQLRGDRAEENTAFPQLKITGEAEDGTGERSTAHIIRLPEGGDAEFLLPGELGQMHKHHDRKLERLREDANMPGGFLGAQTPSGEALREANQKFISSCSFYAERLSRLLTLLVADLSGALQTEPVSVTVMINREFTKASEIETVILLYREGLMDFGAAVRAISVYVPTWSDKDVEAFIEENSPALPPVAPGALSG